jgi:hypothetical protein
MSLILMDFRSFSGFFRIKHGGDYWHNINWVGSRCYFFIWGEKWAEEKQVYQQGCEFSMPALCWYLPLSILSVSASSSFAFCFLNSWENDVVGMLEEKDKKHRVLVSFGCETLKPEKVAEDHIKQRTTTAIMIGFAGTNIPSDACSRSKEANIELKN